MFIPALFVPVLTGLALVEGANWLLEKLVLPVAEVVKNDYPECTELKLTLTQKEMDRLMAGPNGTVARVGVGRTALLKTMEEAAGSDKSKELREDLMKDNPLLEIAVKALEEARD